MTGWGIVLVGLLIVFYVRPYQLATGLVGDSGPYVVMSGELIFALSFGVLLSAGGLFTSWAIKRFNA
jgi:Ni/Fe-hydrogenase subunit HybB-like protein